MVTLVSASYTVFLQLFNLLTSPSISAHAFLFICVTALKNAIRSWFGKKFPPIFSFLSFGPFLQIRVMPSPGNRSHTTSMAIHAIQVY